MRHAPSLVIACLLGAAFATAAEPIVDHRLKVHLDPAAQSLAVVDSLSLDRAPSPDGHRFTLHAGLRPEVRSANWRLERVADDARLGVVGTNAGIAEVPTEGWRLLPEASAEWPVVLAYGGVIDHPLATSGEEYQRSFSETPGLIDERGVFLAGASAWVPTFGDALIRFELEVEGLEPPWDVVSQGRRTRHQTSTDGRRTTAWSSPDPGEEVYLVAGPFFEYEDRTGRVTTRAFLRSDDPALARRYLDATRRYLRLYESVLPPYPYPSFSLVENFWETGYGMPGFTLLGPRVIRFPWILTSSYPHELLHNWWGNSVYVDLDAGNWCEGLTAYMADFLFAEQRGEGTRYRRATLKKYSDFVSSGRDFPLYEFRSRHSATSEAVGYGKSLMLLHMVRRAVGDEAFLSALARFYIENRFRRSSFADLAAAFSAQTGHDWHPFFAAWTSRSGAPELELRAASARRTPDPNRPWLVDLELAQVQEGAPFPVSIPVAVTVEGRSAPISAVADGCGRSCRLEVACPGRPLAVAVDPAFDLMRRLDPLEAPPALSTLFGADHPLYVLPATAGAIELARWRELAAAWARPSPPRIALDAEIDSLPAGTVWVLGAANRLGTEVTRRLADQGVGLAPDSVRLPGETVARAGHSFVLAARGADDPATAVGWVAADPVAAIAGLARKLPHYTRYSYLAFAGDEPENVAKGMWRPLASPLVRTFDGGATTVAAPPARPPLAELPPLFDAARLARTVERLAADEMEGRGLGTPGLERATALVEEWLRTAGLEAAGTNGFRQSWRVLAGEPEREMTLTNLLARVPGVDPQLTDRPVLVTAHLDHLGRGWPDVHSGDEGRVHPGADDNASGVAVLLEVAAALAGEPARPRPLLFAVVTGEETGLLGSRHLLAGLDDDELPFACVNLDTVGRLAGDKLYVLNADTAREWRFLFMGVGYTTGLQPTIVSEPLDASDQGACIERGVPAVQLFTGPHADYHRPSDTAEKIDSAGMATVAEAAHEAVAYLAERKEPLTVTISAAPASGAPQRPLTGGRRASLGTMPDFAFEGVGVRVAEALPGSPAETAGIARGDVLVALDDAPIDGLRSLSAALKGHSPGDTVTVRLLRDGEELSVTAVLGER